MAEFDSWEQQFADTLVYTHTRSGSDVLIDYEVTRQSVNPPCTGGENCIINLALRAAMAIDPKFDAQEFSADSARCPACRIPCQIWGTLRIQEPEE